MGEAKRRGKLRDRVLAANPYCIYCGGSTVASQVDHMPPRTMFEGRLRPQGLEFSACMSCNQGSRNFELAASLLSRIYPDPASEQAMDEVRGLFRKVKQRQPAILDELLPQASQLIRFEKVRANLPPNVHAVRADGPEINAAIKLFAAKLGIALHFSQTGRLLGPEGAIAVRWFSNFQAFAGEIPETFTKMVGPTETLRQGSFDVGDQFAYRWRATPDGNKGVYMARFREAFAVVAALSAEQFDPPPPTDFDGLFRPGFLKNL